MPKTVIETVPVEELAALTDFQIMGIIMRHAENMREMKRQSEPGKKTEYIPPNEKRERAIYAMTHHLGMDRATAERDYDAAQGR